MGNVATFPEHPGSRDLDQVGPARGSNLEHRLVGTVWFSTGPFETGDRTSRASALNLDAIWLSSRLSGALKTYCLGLM